jgi:hypothetical protein
VDAVRQIADAVLYEGYVLWPYRRSALKNTRRWTFGGVYPRAHSEEHPDDRWIMRTECLVEGPPESKVDVRVRFLHVVRRQVMSKAPSGALQPVDELTVDGERYLTWEEATERELVATALPLGELGSAKHVDIAIPPGRDEEQLSGGALVRTSSELEGGVEIAAEALRPGLDRLSVRIMNTTAMPKRPARPGAPGLVLPPGDREEALERTFCSTHTVLRADGAQFVSLTDPPPELRAEAEACRNEGTWPVLVGEPGSRDTLLSSPIILEDHPRIAPESPGDLFDGGEIDGLLTLNILSLTDEEKAEMRDSDPRTREILERTENLSEEEMMRLHGAIRDLRHVH